MGAETFGQREFMVLGLARQVLRQAAAAMGPALPPGWGRLGRRRCLSWLGLLQLEEEVLVRIEAFAAASVQPLQQLLAVLEEVRVC